MEINAAVDQLAALAHETRLAAFRMLVVAGPDGMPAGDVSKNLESPPSTVSFHLAHLARVGLIQSRREGRSIIYSLADQRVRLLLEFLTRDCCQGRPELCTPAIDGALECDACEE